MPKFVVRRPGPNVRRQGQQKKQFENLNAVELYCPKCGRGAWGLRGSVQSGDGTRFTGLAPAVQ